MAITDKQLKTMQDQISIVNFCDGICCQDCPLSKTTEPFHVCQCPRTEIRDKLREIEKQRKKYCSECGSELKKEEPLEENEDDKLY